ncbi:MAG: hypothetical protein P8R54_32210 [Myxococcota bacterium]|nr:hypothetical protein [Myxococcota bacterium]
MSDDTALTLHQQTPAAQPGEHGLSEDATRAVVRQLFEASVASFGDVVSALMFDMEQTEDNIKALSWLAGTQTLLSSEAAFRSAVSQLAWWDRFLAHLPHPALLSEANAAARRRAQSERAHARLMARQAALQDHRQRIADAMADPDTGPADRARLRRVMAAPDETEWWVDVEGYVAAALAQLPPEVPDVPITADDLAAETSFSGFHAVDAFRRHPELGPRAQSMDTELADILAEAFGLRPAEAHRHAVVLTGIFWLALRRALSAGSHQLSASISLMMTTGQGSVQQQFTHELLGSWLPYLQTLPPPQHRKTLGQRIRGWLGLKPRAAVVPVARQLEED